MNLINIVSLYGYDNLFENMIIDERLDKEVVINSIMDYNGEYIPLYPDGELLKAKIYNWSYRIKDGVSRMIDALEKEYNPIENTDRYESWTEKEQGSRNENENRENSLSSNIKTDSQDETSVSAYDSSTYQPRDRNTNSQTDTRKDETSETTNNDVEHEYTKTYEQHTHGNIGVTTNQQMIEAELKLREFNIYTWIAEDFFKNFMLGVSD